jgi:hypothetical protein
MTIRYCIAFHFQGNWRNLQQVLTVTCIPYGNGIEWTTREGAGKYDLTVSETETVFINFWGTVYFSC